MVVPRPRLAWPAGGLLSAPAPLPNTTLHRPACRRGAPLQLTPGRPHGQSTPPPSSVTGAAGASSMTGAVRSNSIRPAANRRLSCQRRLCKSAPVSSASVRLHPRPSAPTLGLWAVRGVRLRRRWAAAHKESAALEDQLAQDHAEDKGDQSEHVVHHRLGGRGRRRQGGHRRGRRTVAGRCLAPQPQTLLLPGRTDASEIGTDRVRRETSNRVVRQQSGQTADGVDHTANRAAIVPSRARSVPCHNPQR